MKEDEFTRFYETAAKALASKFGPVRDWKADITDQGVEGAAVRLTSPVGQGIIDVHVHKDGTACIESISGLTVEKRGERKPDGACYYCDCPMFSGDGVFCNRATCQHHWITH